MGFTNSTTNYGLPQYIGTDKPSYLVDFNGAMSDIDAGIHAAKTQAATAENKADNNTTTLNGMMKVKGVRSFSVTGDGVKTYAEILAELATAVNNYVSAQDANYRFSIARATPDLSSIWECTDTFVGAPIMSNALLPKIFLQGAGSLTKLTQIVISTTVNDCGIASYDLQTNTLTNLSSNTLAAGTNATIDILEYSL